MEGIEIEGKTIDEAIEKACGLFQVPREKLNIEIIADGSPGFLGLGATKARIRAGRFSIDMTIDAVVPEAEARVSTETEQGKGRTTADSGSAAFGADGHGEPVPKTRPSVRPAAAGPPERMKAVESEECRSVPNKESASGAAETEVRPAEHAKHLLEGLLLRMNFSSPVTVEETEETIILNIQGDGSGLLIGKRGQNLDALQYILNKAVHHSANGHKMIVVDTEGYRRRREESLVALALRLGEKVKKTRKPVTVGHMNAHDRRVIHMAMQNDEMLTTKSRGEGEYRKILILPARRAGENADA